MLDWIKKWLRKIETREQRVVRECNCVVWCPECREILNDGSNCHDTDDGLVEFVCVECGCISDWDFDAPVPLYINPLATRKEVCDGQ